MDWIRLNAGALPLSRYYTPQAVGLEGALRIFTVLNRPLLPPGRVGLGKVLHHVKRLDKAWLKGQRHPQNWFALVCMAFAPSNGVKRDAHLDRIPSVLAGAANPSPHHLVRQMAIGDWCPVFFATAFWAVHWALWEHLLLKSGTIRTVDDSKGCNRRSTKN